MRILLADDHDLLRDTLAAFLQEKGGAYVVTAGTLDEALRCAKGEALFDLLILDYNMPGMSGLAGLQKALDAKVAGGVAIVSGSAPSSVAQEAIKNGAIGFLPKTMSANSLLNAVRFMVAGETYFPVSLIAAEAEAHPLSLLLTGREKDVLNGLCRGLSNKEVALELDLQEVTIKLHVRSLCKKMEAKNRTHAAMMAKEQGLF